MRAPCLVVHYGCNQAILKPLAANGAPTSAAGMQWPALMQFQVSSWRSSVPLTGNRSAADNTDARQGRSLLSWRTPIHADSLEHRDQGQQPR
ncbi:hypothetical protein HPP92_005554 [Vanilla planifolia]|uniref:Uncharacterized protein n=1 Tax=Vanilla planifolia TaxID=51239 RepID=A0A835VEZ7_VANPL|nr:hypothetical protein HPP92_005554 [Vanilla planifolia]